MVKKMFALCSLSLLAVCGIQANEPATREEAPQVERVLACGGCKDLLAAADDVCCAACAVGGECTCTAKIDEPQGQLAGGCGCKGKGKG
jgi:hypothetical protein